jgi:hypothetical protein
MQSLCIKCKGKGLCGKPCKILKAFKSNAPKPRLHFSGKSAPEIFVGRVGYPNINAGILAPSENDHLSNFPSAQEWSTQNFSIANVLRLRSQLIYGKTQMNIKQPNRLKQTTQNLALSSKPVSTEIHLKKKPTLQFSIDKVFQPMTNPAPIKTATLEENPHVPKKVDYLINDTDAKSVTALNELYASNIKIDQLQKLLSIGLLGKKTARRMVPTRWSITATDDIISKEHLKKVKYFKHLQEIKLFSGNYLGNYIEALLLPGYFSFEAIEAWLSGSTYSDHKTQFSQDYESYQGRKKYAFNVTGGYYAMRLPLTSYLIKIKRQAQVLIFREITEEYYAPLGVGIVREATKRAFQNQPQSFDTIQEALQNIQSRIKTPTQTIQQKSWLLNNYNKQRSIFDFY